MFNKIMICVILLLCFWSQIGYSKESHCVNGCMNQYAISYDDCTMWCHGGDYDDPNADMGPPLPGGYEPPMTSQQCGRLWEKCIQSGKVEKSKCDALKNGCNNNWGK